jgi:hypothetical protein
VVIVLLSEQGHPCHKPKGFVKVDELKVPRNTATALWLVAPLRQPSQQTRDIFRGDFLQHIQSHVDIIYFDSPDQAKEKQLT